MMSNSIRSICIVRLSALGDVLMLVPLVRTLQQYCPDAQITWVISPPAYFLVEGMEGVEFIVINKPNSIKDYWLFYKQMRRRSFDVLLAAQASFRANLLYAGIRALRKIGYDSLRAKDGHHYFINETIQPGKDHTVDGFLRFAAALGIKERAIRWDLPIPDACVTWAKQQLTPERRLRLLVNPAASKPERTWPIDRTIAVIRHAKTRWNVDVILSGGPGEYDKMLGDQIESQVAVINLIGKTKPKQLLAVIQLVDLVLCPDTGPSHMATAVNTPVIALHAVTSAAVSGPYLCRHLAVDYYPTAVERVLNTTEENNVWGTHAHGEKTMELVPVADVICKLDIFFSELVTKN